VSSTTGQWHTAPLRMKRRTRVRRPGPVRSNALPMLCCSMAPRLVDQSLEDAAHGLASKDRALTAQAVEHLPIRLGNLHGEVVFALELPTASTTFTRSATSCRMRPSRSSMLRRSASSSEQASRRGP